MKHVFAIKNSVVIFIFAIILSACSQKSEKSVAHIAFEQGDLVFRKGTGVKSRAVFHADSSGVYSHVGIVVWKDSVFQVVHTTLGEREKGEEIDRIKIESISTFWRKDRAKYGAVYRLKNNGLGEKAAQEALRLLAEGVPFDHDYELEDSTKMYCTELVWYAYLQAGQDISFGKRSEMNVPLYSGI